MIIQDLPQRRPARDAPFGLPTAGRPVYPIRTPQHIGQLFAFHCNQQLFRRQAQVAIDLALGQEGFRVPRLQIFQITIKEGLSRSQGQTDITTTTRGNRKVIRQT